MVNEYGSLDIAQSAALSFAEQARPLATKFDVLSKEDGRPK